MEHKKSKKGLWIALTALALVLAACLALYFGLRPAGVQGGKTITIQVVHGDGKEKEFQVETEQEYLGRALVEKGIVEDNQGSFGLYILTADGETADEGRQEWWRITKDGELLTTGADEAPIADGERYELTLTVGW